MGGAVRSCVRWKALAAVIFAHLLLLSALLKDRGKSEEPSTDFFPPTGPLKLQESTDNQDEWRFSGDISLFPGARQLLEERKPFPALLDCNTLTSLLENSSFFSAGWTKAVYQAAAPGNDGDLALKVVNSNGEQVQNCLESGKKPEECYKAGAEKLVQEASLLRQLDHPALPQLLGYCIPRRPYELPNKEQGYQQVVLATPLGRPLNLISVLQTDWEGRLQILHSLAGLLVYLAESPLGPLGVRDFRRQQFVTGLHGEEDGGLALVDVDDMQIGDPSCRSDADCRLPANQIGQSESIRCQLGQCSGLNELTNLQKANKLFYSVLLKPGTPPDLEAKVDGIIRKLSALQLSSRQLLAELDSLLGRFSSTAKEENFQTQNVSFVWQPNARLSGEAGSYTCVGSKRLDGCYLSVASLTEAKEICAAQPACQSFEWTNSKTWTGRHIVILKNEARPTVSSESSDLFLRN